ncbi:MAG: GNAT family N-acetyltransferase [Sediminicola sp.]|tara:strand:- start:111085 stop:111534 length:450 start_codon:yes stop_codon:yes gene_type:complete
MELENLNSRSALFFGALPQEWQQSIVPFWENIQENATIYAVVEDDKILVGGIVFTENLPQMTDFERSHAAHFFSKGYLYIGFLWVDPDRRNEKLGSKWLQLLKVLCQDKPFWLTIEEMELRKFYERNGFVMIAESPDPANPEWLCVYEP